MFEFCINTPKQSHWEWGVESAIFKSFREQSISGMFFILDIILYILMHIYSTKKEKCRISCRIHENMDKNI